MPEINAKLVNDLRARTGLGMMECKKMLTETGGDIDKAIAEFRKKGVKTSVLERAATEGRVAVQVSGDGKTAAAVAVNCNTDFAAKSETVAKVLEIAIAKLMKNASANPTDDADVQAAITAAAQVTGENIQIGKYAAVSGAVGAYIYAITGKIGVLMSFTGNPDAELIKQLGGHIAFARPVGLTRDEVPAELVEKERAFAVEQAKATGKPQQIAEKIAEGKLNSFFAERVLLDQEFFNAQVFKGSIKDMLKSKGLTLNKYVRLEVGQ